MPTPTTPHHLITKNTHPSSFHVQKSTNPQKRELLLLLLPFELIIQPTKRTDGMPRPGLLLAYLHAQMKKTKKKREKRGNPISHRKRLEHTIGTQHMRVGLLLVRPGPWSIDAKSINQSPHPPVLRGRGVMLINATPWVM